MNHIHFQNQYKPNKLFNESHQLRIPANISPHILSSKEDRLEMESQGNVSDRSTPNSDSTPGKLFVGGLSWQTTQDKLREYFGKFGKISDVQLMKDPITQRSRGFAFITFATPEALDQVISVPSHSLDGKKIDPKPATPKSESKANKTRKIFVGGVSHETSSEEVQNYFNQFGTVEETVMLMDQQTKRHRGFGFVTFENEDSVNSVCGIHYHTINNKKVECKKAQPKEAVQATINPIMLGGGGFLSNPGMLQSAAGPSMSTLQQPQQIINPGALQMLLQQQMALSSNAGCHGKMTGRTDMRTAAERYSPYPVPAYSPVIMGSVPTPSSSFMPNSGIQYSVNNPLMPIPLSLMQQRMPKETQNGTISAENRVLVPSTQRNDIAHKHDNLEAVVSPIQHAAAHGTNNSPSDGIQSFPQAAYNPFSVYNMANLAAMGYTVPPTYPFQV